MSADPQETKTTAFAAKFHEELVKVTSAHFGKPWQGGRAEAASSERDPAEEVAAAVMFAGGLSGKLHLNLTRSDALVLASALLADTSSEFGGAETDALTQLLKSTLASFCQSETEAYGNISAEVIISSAAAPETSEGLTFTLTDAEGLEVVLRAVVSPELAESVAAAIEGHAPISGLGDSRADSSLEPADPVNLEIVLDVELNVTLRFGQRSLTLREVLELTSGSVIELDRQVEEPVELLLEGRVIARGEAVVIDGNYGLRVTEVPQQLTPTILR